MSEQVVLVAFQVRGDTMEAAQSALLPLLPTPDGQDPVLSWWVAEDERYDGSDNDSAVFVHPDRQAEAARLLFLHGLTAYNNIPGGE